MSTQVKRIVLRTPTSVGAYAQYTALRQCREHAASSLADRNSADASAAAAAGSAVVARAARDQAVASVGVVKVSVADARAKPLVEALNVDAPLVATVENPGADERLLLSAVSFGAAGEDAAGSSGLVPAPAAGQQRRVLRADATWQELTPQSLGLGLVENVPALDRRTGTAKGDLLVYQASGQAVRLPAGTNGQVLVADSTQAVGLKYASQSGGGWTTFEETVTRTADATFTVTDTTANQAIFSPGRPIRFRQNTSTAWLYAMVTAYAAGVVTLAGAPYTAAIGADSGRQMQYGEMTRLQQETFQIAGRFAAVATTQALKDYLLLNYAWLRGKAYCVGFRVLPLVDDSGAAQPRVNVRCNGNLVSTSNSGAGLAVSDAAWTATATDIDPAGYALGFGQALELTIDANGTNDDARDLTVIVSLVLE